MKKLLLLIALSAMVWTLSAQSFEWTQKSASPTTVQPKSAELLAYEKAYNERQVGTANVYPTAFQGNRTIYGETYNNQELTVSHSILPLGTLVRIINLDNNRSVTARVNDRGRECTTCLLTLSGAAAAQIGASYQARVSVERVGFSNWNPAPAVANRSNQPASYQNPQTTIYANSPAAGGVVRPVTIQGDAAGWQSKNTTAPATYNSPATYQQPNAYYGNSSNYATLGAPRTSANSVMTREVTPSPRSNQPATYSRYPTTVRPQSPNVAAPVYQPVRQPQAYGSVQTPAATQSVVRPFQPNAQAGPQPVAAFQAAPPASTVARFQDQRTVAAPTTFQNPNQTARSVQPFLAPAAAAPSQGYVVQLGAYNNELYAKNRVNQLRQAGLTNVFYRSANKADGQVINRVYAGTYASMADAQTESNNIRLAHGIAGIVTSL